MNREHWKAMLPVIQAFVEGKTVQCRNSPNLWEDDEAPDFCFGVWEWRIKPTPRLRPWRSEEVPVGAVVRSKWSPVVRRVIIAVESDTDETILGGIGTNWTGASLLRDWERLDGSPCGVEEEE